MENASAKKVLILGHQDVALGQGMLPHGVVSGPTEAEVDDVGGLGMQIGEIADEPRGEVLVEEELQGDPG